MLVVLDTNVIMSAIFWGGIPRSIVDLWIDGRFIAAASEQIVEEYHEIFERLNKKYKVADKDIFGRLISSFQMYKVDNLTENICKDPDDDVFIACALCSDANFIVTGDKLLLDVSSLENGCKITTPQLFISSFNV